MSHQQAEFDRSSGGGHEYELCIHFQEFNELFRQAIEDSLSELLVTWKLSSLYDVLEKHHSITRDELPYRLETVYSVLKYVFGVKGTRNIEKRIVRIFYENLGFTFYDAGYTMEEYVEQARKRIYHKWISRIIPSERYSKSID